MSKDKIREIVEGSSWYEEGEWGVRDAIRDTLVNAIYQATRLDKKKLINIITNFGLIRDKGEYISQLSIEKLVNKIYEKQDKLTKE